MPDGYEEPNCPPLPIAARSGPEQLKLSEHAATLRDSFRHFCGAATTYDSGTLLVQLINAAEGEMLTSSKPGIYHLFWIAVPVQSGLGCSRTEQENIIWHRINQLIR